MMVGNGKLFVDEYNAMVDYAREHRLGIFGAENSDAFKAKLDADFAAVFAKPTVSNATSDLTEENRRGAMTEFSVERFLAEVANGRLCRGKEPDIASLIGTWLCEFECSSRTGQAYDISGAECVAALAAAGYEIVPRATPVEEALAAGMFGRFPDWRNLIRKVKIDYDEISPEPQFYARQGEEITCENGHVICEVVKDIPMGHPLSDTSCLGHWRDPEPAIGTPPEEAGCCRCGAPWFGFVHFHFKDGWR